MVQTSDQSVACSMCFGTSLEFRSNDPVATMIVRGEAGEIAQQAIVEAWGDEGSGAHWWPFGWLGEAATTDNLRIAIDRARTVVSRLTFYDKEPIFAPDGREAAVIDYLRLASGVTDEWGISLAAPFELRLDDPYIGEGHGLLYTFDELPPGLSHLGECALVSEAREDRHDWWMRPVMCTFGNELDDLTLDDLQKRLLQFELSKEEIRRLNKIAIEIEEAYEWETGDC
jgi:hypothetical protein